MGYLPCRVGAKVVAAEIVAGRLEGRAREFPVSTRFLSRQHPAAAESEEVAATITYLLSDDACT